MEHEPMFSPLAARYQEKYVDRPRTELLGLLDFPFQDVLEIGCGSGATGETIKRQHPEVVYTGVEIDPGAASEARRVLDRVVTADIERVNPEHLDLRPQTFDVILCADVLEHLYDPWTVVRTLRTLLRPEGRLVASIPNSQNIRLVQNLISGYWTYSPQGLLDATHVRFFTLHEIGKLFVGNGYTIEQVISSCDADMPQAGPWPRDLDLGRVVFRNLSRDDMQQLYTFQYLIRARRAPFNGKGGAS